MYGYSATDTDRRLANIVQIGRVSAVDLANGLAQVDLDGPGTDWIPWATARAGNDRTWWAPEVGEQVVVAAPSGELSSAVIIGCLFQDTYNEPADSADVHRTVYKDGTVVEYDRAAHQYKIDVSASSGSVVVICKNATVQASEKVLVDTPDAEFTGNVLVQKRLTYRGGMAGSNVNGEAGAAAVIDGDFRAANGAFEHNGKDVGSTHTHTAQGANGVTTPPN